MMKKLGVSYSRYFNNKYERTGHLFQDRYLSEAVEDDAYLLTVFRYILNNPKKAGICPAKDYRWNSYPLYEETDGFVDASPIRSLLGDSERYAAFIDADNEDQCLEYKPAKRDDAWAREVMHKSLKINNGMVLQSYDRAKRDAAIRWLKSEGLTVRQIERLTGINRGIIQKL